MFVLVTSALTPRWTKYSGSFVHLAQLRNTSLMTVLSTALRFGGGSFPSPALPTAGRRSVPGPHPFGNSLWRYRLGYVQTPELGGA
jgi:hypothetical protein